jgi:hypothetical protein
MPVTKQKKTPDHDLSDRRGPSWEELAKLQGVSLGHQLDRVTGGWPEDERDDKFEEAVARWRRESLSSQIGG